MTVSYETLFFALTPEKVNGIFTQIKQDQSLKGYITGVSCPEGTITINQHVLPKQDVDAMTDKYLLLY